MTLQTDHPISRRSALVGVGAGGLGLALANAHRSTSAQDASAELASHPAVGAWRAITPGGPAMSIFHPDGTAIFTNPPTAVDPALGVVSLCPAIGTWEPTGERSIHFTATSMYSDASGAFLNYSTTDGYPEISEDGQTLQDDQSKVKITIRNADGVIAQEILAAGAPPVVGYRITVGSPGFPEGTPEAGTPTT